jgi:hypothetical protein
VNELEEFLRNAAHVLNETDNGLVKLQGLRQEPSAYFHAIDNVFGHRMKGIDGARCAETVKRLVEFSARGELRILRPGNGLAALLQFERVIDEEFDKVVILDASAPIREALQYDDSIEVVPTKVEKDYSSVNLYVADVLSSKDSFERGRHLDRYFQEIQQIVEERIPKSDDVLLFCHKELEDRVMRFKADLECERRGVMHVVRWGRHRATNEYAHVKWLFTIGVLYMPDDAIASMILGQTGNLSYPLAAPEVRRVKHSEQAEMLYQAISRGNSRRTVDGRAGDETIFLFHPLKDSRHVVERLREVMPGLRVEPYYPRFLLPNRKGAIDVEGMASEIGEVLKAVPAEKDAVSVAEVKLAIGAGLIDTNSRVWRRAAAVAPTRLDGWRKEEKRYCRVVS